MLSLVTEDRDVYYKTLQFLKCHDPLVIPLKLFKSCKGASKFIPPIEHYHLVLYLVLERNLTDSERYEAYKNLDSEQYLSNTFTDKLLVFPLSSGVVIIRTHVTHFQFLSIKPEKPGVAFTQQEKSSMLFATVLLDWFTYVCNCVSGVTYIFFIHRLGSVCIHVSALLQLAVAAQEDDSTIDDSIGISVTSLPCSLNKPGKGPVTIYTTIYFNSR